MKKILLLIFSFSVFTLSHAQMTVNLDSCRQMALKYNKGIQIAQLKKEKASYDSKVAATNYLPKVSLAGGYMRTGREISLLTDEQKAKLSGIGTNLVGAIQSHLPGLTPTITSIVTKYPEFSSLFTAATAKLTAFENSLNQVGSNIADAFRTDNRNMGGAAILLTQPLYMGGKIKAYDRITHYAEQLADYQLAADEQEVVLSTDQAYWQVVSLYNKKKLAENYLDMLRAMQKDVEAMVKEGFTTHANQLSVDVKVNEAEMTLTKVEDGLILSKMLLCETCGLPLDSDIMPEDAKLADINTADAAEMSNMDEALTNRSELKQLEAAINIYEEKVKIERSAFLPQIALVGGYAFYTPNVYNGFSNKIKGDWSIGVTMKVPVWNWGEGKYKVRAAKAEAAMQRLKLSDAREKIMLQVNQSSFRINEANKKLTMSLKNLEKAEENLRTAQVGFKEGVINTTETLAAQTAWLQAQSDKIDAQIDLRLSKSLYQKALGTLRP